MTEKLDSRIEIILIVGENNLNAVCKKEMIMIQLYTFTIQQNLISLFHRIIVQVEQRIFVSFFVFVANGRTILNHFKYVLGEI